MTFYDLYNLIKDWPKAIWPKCVSGGTYQGQPCFLFRGAVEEDIEGLIAPLFFAAGLNYLGPMDLEALSIAINNLSKDKKGGC